MITGTEDRRKLFVRLAVVMVLLLVSGLTATSGWAQSDNPMVTGPAALTASDAAPGDNFGYSVAVDGDTAVVGVLSDDLEAGRDAGSARVFVRAPGGWTEQATLAAVDAAPDDRFGWAVAVDGDTAVVGVPFDDPQNARSAGSVRVFTRTGTDWTEQATLAAAAPDAGELLGFSVALDGDTVVAGAPTMGVARVFERSGTEWAETAALDPPDGEKGDNFGWSVAVEGPTILVGAVGDDTAAGADAGTVRAYSQEAGHWREQALFTASDAAPDDNFGWAVGAHGGTAVVGVPLDDTANGGHNAGSVRVFTAGPDGAWAEEAALTAPDGAATDNFGWSVAVLDGTAVIGSPLDDTEAGPDAGSARVFSRSSRGWTESATLTAPDPLFADNFGQSVGLARHAAVMGAAFDDTVAGGNAGSAAVAVLDQPPVALRDHYAVAAGAELTVPPGQGLLANDTDADHDHLAAERLGNVPPGLDLDPDGSFSYRSAPGVTGEVSFTYRAVDGYSASEPATVVLEVLPVPGGVPPAPSAASDGTPPARGAAAIASPTSGPETALSRPSLPQTGASARSGAAAGLLLLVAGLGALAAGARRRASQ